MSNEKKEHKFCPIIKLGENGKIRPIIDLSQQRLVPIIFQNQPEWASNEPVLVPIPEPKPNAALPTMPLSYPVPLQPQPLPVVAAQEDDTADYCGDFCRLNGLSYWDAEKKKYIYICNYIPYITRVFVYKSQKYGDRKRLEVQVNIAGGDSCRLPVWAADLPSLHAHIKRHCTDAYLYCNRAKADLKLDHFVSQQISRFVPSIIFEDSGWQEWQGSHVYFHDGIRLNGVECRCGKSMIRKHEDPVKALRDALEFLLISTDLEKILIPFLFIHLGLLYTLFDQAGYPLRFLLFVNGTTGSLKTAVSKALFHVFNDKPPAIPATFKDTVASLELKMEKEKDAVLLLDDFHPASSKGEEMNMKRTLESLIRFFGDGVGKARATSSMDIIKETKPCGLCAITGEDTGGSMSSLLRCVLINIDAGTYIGPVLEHFQANPDILSTHYAHFVDRIGKEYDDVVAYIKENFVRYRKFFDARLKFRRLSDAGTSLFLMIDILAACAANLGFQAGFLPVEHWQAAIVSALQASETTSKDMNPATMYLYALNSLTISKGAVIAANEAAYMVDIDKYIGYEDGTYLWVDPDRCYRLVVRYWQQCGKYFALSQSKTHAALYSAGCLIVPRQDKVTKYLCRTSFPPRPYYLKINCGAMLRLLELDE